MAKKFSDQPYKLPRITEMASRMFAAQLRGFRWRAGKAWTNAALLRTAGMDPSLIRRIGAGESFATGSLDRLQGLMEDIVAGRVTQPAPTARAKAKQRRQ